MRVRFAVCKFMKVDCDIWEEIVSVPREQWCKEWRSIVNKTELKHDERSAKKKTKGI